MIRLRKGSEPAAPALALVPVLIIMLLSLVGTHSWAQIRTYTLDADFDEGFLVNVNHDPPNNDQLQLNYQTMTFPFIWVACSARGTVVRINVSTGEILGEYLSAPQGRGRNPSRTTVDFDGNVWTGNRDEIDGGWGSVVKFGLVVGGTRCDADGTPNPMGQYLKPPFDYSTAVDRDGDGLIKTSRGLGNILAWPDVTDGAGGATGIVEDADDECVLIYQRVHGDYTRHVSIDANNNVWCAGNFGGDNAFDLLDGATGAILASFDVGAGGYGGLVDGNGVIWSANRGPGPVTVLWYDTKNTLTTADDAWQLLDAPNAYGLGIDTNGHVWNAQWTSNAVHEFAPNGGLLNVYPSGGTSGDRGVAVTLSDNNVWVANSSGNDVSRLASNGVIRKVINLGGDGQTPTGVAVDANGKVWVTCYSSNTAKRIDPNGDMDGLGAVDLTVDLGPGAGPYNYSDMTGTVLFSAIQQGTWRVVHDSGEPGIEWGNVRWNDEPQGAVPPGTHIKVEVRAADAIVNLPAQPWIEVMNGVDFSGVFGQYLEVRTTLSRQPGIEETPVLSDLTVRPLVRTVYFDIKPTSCPNPLNVKPFPDEPDNAKHNKGGVLPVAILGTEDFDVYEIDVSTVTLLGLSPIRHSYEDVAAPLFDPEECECTTAGPDGYMDLTLKFQKADIVAVIGPVSPGDLVPLKIKGYLTNGIPFEGVDCVWILGEMIIVRHSNSDEVGLGPAVPNPFNPRTRMSYYLPQEAFVEFSVFDVAGRLVERLVSQTKSAGEHTVEWDARGVPSGIYFYRLQVGDFNESRKLILLK